MPLEQRQKSARLIQAIVEKLRQVDQAVQEINSQDNSDAWIMTLRDMLNTLRSYNDEEEVDEEEAEI